MNTLLLFIKKKKIMISLASFLGIILILLSYIFLFKDRFKITDLYLKGGDIHLQISSDRKTIYWYEGPSLMMESQKITETQLSNKIIFELKKVKHTPLYENTYGGLDIFKVEIFKKNEEYILKVPEIGEYEYVFLDKQEEKEDLIGDYSFYEGKIIEKNLEKMSNPFYGDVKLKVSFSASPLKSFEEVINDENSSQRSWIRESQNLSKNVSSMEEYVLDEDKSTAFISETPLNFEPLQGQIIFSEPILIRAFLFHLGNLFQNSQYNEYHRPYKVGIFFSDETTDTGLGFFKENYNQSKIFLDLSDNKERRLLLFSKLKKVKKVKFVVYGWYPGEKNNLAWFDFIPLVDRES